MTNDVEPPVRCENVNRILATTTSVWSDDVWVVDSTPVERGRSRETVKRSDLAGGPNTATAPATAASSGACTWTGAKAITGPLE